MFGMAIEVDGGEMASPAITRSSVVHLVPSPDVAALPYQRTRAPRQRTLIRAVLGGMDMPDQDVIIRNISEYGMGIASRGFAPDRGETVTITLPSGIALKAQVRWVNDKAFGVQLFEELDVRQLGLSTQRRHTRPTGSAIDWRMEDRYRQEEPQPIPLRRCC